MDIDEQPLPKSLRILLEPVHQWLNILNLQQHSPHTLKAYFAGLRNLAIFLSDKKLTWTQCDKRQLANHISHRLENDKISLNSAQQELSAIRHYYNWLIETKQASINPTSGYQLKRQPRRLPNIADIDLIIQLLDQPEPESLADARLWVRDKAMFELLYGSGLRVAELVNLDIQDIDLTNQICRVLGKGNKTRLAPIGSKSKTAIEKYLPHRQLWLEKNDTALFISERLGTRITTRTVQHRLKIAAKRAGIAQNLYPHLLRHCFASHLLSSSGDLRAIQELLGHQNISTTQIYTHVDFAKLTQVYDQAHPRANQKTPKNHEV